MAKTAAATLLLLATLALAVPAASAHTTTSTSDGKYFITTGHLNEPISTYAKTGLDLIIRANNSGVRGGGIPGAHLTLNATLVGPGGEQHTEPLRAQFGVPGGYSFLEPYYLTKSGVYTLRLTGRINQTTIDLSGLVVGSSTPIPAFEGLTFPDDAQNPTQLADRIAALEAENLRRKADVAALQQKRDSGNAPGLDPVLTLVVVAAIGIALARRKA